MNDLFDRLPQRLFSPLASANRRIYANLLLNLYPLFFDQIHADVFPSRETLRYEIEEQLARMSLVWQEEAEEEEVVADDLSPAAIVYRRLRSAGWFDEESEGYRVHVAVSPAVSQIWTALMEVARPDKVFYGGMVLSIHNNLQQAIKDPQDQALALRQAAMEAKRFLQHLNSMIYGLKGMLEHLRGLEDHRGVLSGFFEEFVENFLVQDYKRLTTRNNPFRFRQHILQGIQELEFDTGLKQALVNAYMSQSGEEDSEAAWRAVNDDIDRIRHSFERVDAHLGRINRYRAKVESRVADTVRYLDRSQPGQAARLARLYRQLALRLEDAGDESSMDWLPVRGDAPLGMFSLFEPRKTHKPPSPSPLRRRAPDPKVQARQAALRVYLDKRRIDPKRVHSYLLRQMAGRDSIAGQDMNINSVEDFIAFTHVRHLPYLSGGGRLRREFRLERMDGWVDNEWLRCPAFVIHRKETSYAA